MTARGRPRAGEATVRARKVDGGLVLRAELRGLRATVALRGRHRCVALLEEGVYRLRETEEPKASCRIEEVSS